MQGRSACICHVFLGYFGGGTRGTRVVCDEWVGLVEASGVLAAFDPQACQRIWGIGLSRRLPRTRHASPPWWALQLRNQHYYRLEMYIFNLWNGDSFAWFMVQGEV